MKSDERKLIFDINPNLIKDNSYKLLFPPESKYHGGYVVINLESCNVDNSVANRLYYTDKFYKTLPVNLDGGPSVLTLAEIVAEFDC